MWVCVCMHDVVYVCTMCECGFVYMCARCVDVGMHTPVHSWGQKTTCISPLLPLCGFQGSCCQMSLASALTSSVSASLLHILSLNCIHLLFCFVLFFVSLIYKLGHFQNKLRLFMFWSFVEIIDMITLGWKLNQAVMPCISGIVLPLWHIC